MGLGAGGAGFGWLLAALYADDAFTVVFLAVEVGGFDLDHVGAPG